MYVGIKTNAGQIVGNVKNKLLQEKTEENNYDLAVENLAQSLNCSKEEVNALYSTILRDYMQRARVKLYIPVLVVKRVKELMRNKNLPPDFESHRNRSIEL